MIKKIFLGLLILSVFVSFGSVSAETLDSVDEGSNSSTSNAVVGMVEAPIYSVEIEWDALKYNWVYNEETKTFGWEVERSYECLENDNLMDEDTFYSELPYFYSDSTCSTKVDEDISYTDYETNYSNSVKYYVRSQYGEELNQIYITDYSENGSIVPSVEWKSSSNYDFVKGSFEYTGMVGVLIEDEVGEDFSVLLEHGLVCLDENCDTYETDLNAVFEKGKYYAATEGNKKLTTAEIPEDGRIAGMVGHWYSVYLYIENDDSKTISTPKSGDIIGNVTVSIKAAD